MCIHHWQYIKTEAYQEDDNPKIITSRLHFYCDKCLSLRSIQEEYEKDN